MPIIALIGPSGAGKSTLVDHYVQHHPSARLHASITTRPIRSSSDISHQFVTDETFDKLASVGQLIQPVEAFGYRYAITKIPEHDGATFVLLRHQFVKDFRRFYPDTHVVQIEAPVDILLRRLSDREDTMRANAEALQAEISAGQSLAEFIIVTNKPIKNTHEEFDRLCGTLL